MVCCEGEQPSSHLNLMGYLYLFCCLSFSLKIIYFILVNLRLICRVQIHRCLMRLGILYLYQCLHQFSFCTLPRHNKHFGCLMECGAVAFWEKSWYKKAAMHRNRCFCLGNNSVKECCSMLSQDETKPNNQHGVLRKS